MGHVEKIRRKPEWIEGTVAAAVLTLICACSPVAVPVMEKSESEITVRLEAGRMGVKSVDPDEDAVSNVNLFVFNEEGDLEERRFIDRRHMKFDDDTAVVRIRLLKNSSYDIFACVNFGYALENIASEDDITGFRYYLSYPDEYSEGIPACGSVKGFVAGDRTSVTVPLTRMMSKISVSMDRSRLDKGVKMIVRSVKIGNCPKSCLAFGQSGAMSDRDVFQEGFIKRYSDADSLNVGKSDGLSGEVSVYMFENIQDTIKPGVSSYIELKSEYQSDEKVNKAGEYLIYRFYLEDPDGKKGVERNCRYHVTVRPNGDGLLSEDSWKVDKSGLENKAGGKITVHPGTYIEAMPGDTVHVWAELDPEDAQFTMGMEELEDDRKEGIYDYKMDEDGRGVTLYLKNPGSGLLYMSSGNPVSDSAVIVVVVDHYPET